jgi:hypothetical protein
VTSLTANVAAEAESLLRVENVVKEFPVRSGRLLNRNAAKVHAVAGGSWGCPKRGGRVVARTWAGHESALPQFHAMSPVWN